jgi:hypothetical protein
LSRHDGLGPPGRHLALGSVDPHPLPGVAKPRSIPRVTERLVALRPTSMSTTRAERSACSASVAERFSSAALGSGLGQIWRHHRSRRWVTHQRRRGRRPSTLSRGGSGSVADLRLHTQRTIASGCLGKDTCWHCTPASQRRPVPLNAATCAAYSSDEVGIVAWSSTLPVAPSVTLTHSFPGARDGVSLVPLST